MLTCDYCFAVGINTPTSALNPISRGGFRLCARCAAAWERTGAARRTMTGIIRIEREQRELELADARAGISRGYGGFLHSTNNWHGMN